MRWDVLFLTLLVGLSGCTQKATLVKDGVGVHLKEVEWDITNLTEGIWKVGKTYRNTVSKNLNVVLSLPHLEDSDEDFLAKTYGVDAWLVRVIQSNAQGSRIELATLYAPFRAQQKGRTSKLHVKAVSFTLTYAASAISERFRKFQCPAFSHNLRLDEYDVFGKKEPMEILLRADAPFNEKLTTGELVPTALNIGHTMVGEYYFETALFSTTKKQIYSSFARIPMSVKVLTEKSVTVDGCSGVHNEYEPAN
ncbi:MAG: hypothetical protein K2P81_07955 [Bacteriovoracaceae bacterium]|nr:hypothetical protein [Bacteriovoracaceae bacterium]